MKKKLLIMAMTMTMAAACLTGCSSKQKSGSVSTDGSTSMEKVIGALGESFTEKNPKVNFSYNPTGSGSGITAVSEEKCDIGLSSRHLKDEEKAGGLEETVIAMDGIAMIVNTSNKVSDLTLEQITDIYTGKITNWSQVGGADGEIVVVGREAGSGTRDGFESITNTKDICVLRQEPTSTGDVIAIVKGNENAIGYASLAAVDNSVSTISIGGVIPSAETILDGSYAIQRPFILVTKEGRKLSDAAQDFVDYALSKEAKEVIKGAGVVPLK